MQILNEPEIYQNIAKRYEQDIIFTYVGQILIVVNPYKTLEEEYGRI